MIKIIKILLGILFFAATAYLIRQDETGKTIGEAYRFPTGGASAPTEAQPPRTPPIDKTQVDLLLQQQYQKTLSQPPAEDELSDSEKLRKLDEAMHELDSAEDEYDRELAVMTLGKLTSAEARQGIVTALQDESKLVVNQAIRQINKWPDATDRTEMLLTALSSNNEELVEETLLIISVVDDKRLITRLNQLSKHINPGIREAAKLALNLAP